MRRDLNGCGALLFSMSHEPLPPPNEILARAFDASRFRHIGNSTTVRLEQHLLQAQKRMSAKSYPGHSPSDERMFWEDQKPDNIAALHDLVLERSNHLQDPRYLGHQVAAVLPESAATGMVTDLLNNGQAIFEMGPSNAVHEDLLMTEIGEMLGLPSTCGGILCHGGTLGNLVALLAAQRRMAMELGVDTLEEGIRAIPGSFVVLVSERAHYCIDRAMQVMGWGAQSTIRVHSDDNHRMCMDDLMKKLVDCQTRGLHVMAVVGSACTTSAGAFDPLDAMANVCRTHNLWLHVDGAHGAAASFSNQHRHLVQGMGRANSIVLDFHKACGLPALCTGVFYREHADSFLPFAQHAEYLWDSANDLDWWDTGKRTLECTKRMLSTRIAAIKAEHGWGIWGEIVDRLWAIGARLGAIVANRKGWELAMEPQANIVCFRPKPESNWGHSDWNNVVRSLRKRHLEMGSGYVVQTEFDGKVWLRCALMNPLTEECDLLQMLDEFESLLPSVMENMAAN